MNNLANVAKLFFVFIFVYFFYKGITTLPWEGDSLAYHLPIARNLLSGKYTNFQSLLEYYPGASEIILAALMATHVPLNLFNLFGWLFLFAVCYKLARHFGLQKESSIVFSAAVAMLTSVVRLIPTQTVDIWLAAFYLYSVLLLERPKNTWRYYLLLGTSVGMVVGSKYSGPLFTLPLIVLYGPRFIRKINIKWIASLLPICILGLSWYFRNWYFMGAPLYPSSSDSFRLLNWQLWKTPLLLPNGTFLLIQALLSEYLIWIISPIIALKTKISPLKFLGFANLAICMFLPTWPENIISDLRYTYVAFIPLVLVTFLSFQDNNRSEEISLAAILAMISVVPQLDYFPKLFVLVPAVLLLFSLKSPNRPAK